MELKDIQITKNSITCRTTNLKREEIPKELLEVIETMKKINDSEIEITWYLEWYTKAGEEDIRNVQLLYRRR